MRYLAGTFKLPYDPALCLTFLTRRRTASFFVSSMYRLEAYLFFASIANISSIFKYLDHSNMLFSSPTLRRWDQHRSIHKSFVYRRALLQWEAMCTELVRRSVVASQAWCRDQGRARKGRVMTGIGIMIVGTVLVIRALILSDGGIILILLSQIT